jgi:hypothetical protein
MSAGERRRYEVRDKQGAQWIGSLVAGLEPGWTVTIAPPSRSLDQNAIFHALCDDIAKARPEWNGLSMSAEDWKQLLILSHAVATSEGGIRLTQDLEGQGLVQLRESSARMSKARATSLIDYTMAWAAQHGVKLRATE